MEWAGKDEIEIVYLEYSFHLNQLRDPIVYFCGVSLADIIEHNKMDLLILG